MSSDDSLLLGTDLVKDPKRLVAAYDDAAGVTADFNRNVLHVLNEQLGGDFDPELFRHVALWNEDEQWIEMRLRAEEATEVSLAGAGITVRFDEGEDLLTEISAKFTPERVEQELTEAGFVRRGDVGGRGRGVPPLPGPPVLLSQRRRLSRRAPAPSVTVSVAQRRAHLRARTHRSTGGGTSQTPSRTTRKRARRPG